MVSIKVIALAASALSMAVLSEAAMFNCNRSWRCSAVVSTGNTYQFGRIEGCTGDGNYCSHATTNNEITDVKIWVRNGNAGCTVTGNFNQWILLNTNLETNSNLHEFPPKRLVSENHADALSEYLNSTPK
ncbi:hypothetical protein BGW38_001690, partial [Lunasporangiospora selenospora]